MEDTLKKLQNVELGITRKILDIISRHNLTYYILGGTLLGAVRHKGFIPWDDDMDIGMPRPDYEQFLSFAEEELSPPYELHTGSNGRGLYSYYYARVVNNDVKLRRTKSETEVIIPAWVDVFPLDGVPSNRASLKIWVINCKFYYTLYKISQFQYYFAVNTVRDKKNAALKIACKKMLNFLHLEALLNTQKIWKKLDHALKQNNYMDSSFLVNFCGYWGMKEMFPKSVYGEGRLYTFDDLMLMGPVNYDFVLSQMYGDYMTPPPEDQRNHHSVSLLDYSK